MIYVAACMETAIKTSLLYSRADDRQTETDRHNTSPVLDTEPTQTCENPIDSNGTQDIKKEQIFHPGTDGDIRGLWETILDGNPGTISKLARSFKVRSERRRIISGFQPRRDILDRDENGEYQEHLTIQIDGVTDFLQDQLYLFQKIFLANIQTLTKFLNCLYKIKPIHSKVLELQNLLSKLNDFPVLRWPLIPHGKTKQLDRLHTAQLGLRYLLTLLPPPPPTRPPPIRSLSSAS